MQLLRNGIHAHFPNVNPNMDSDYRFFVHLKDFGSPTYVMIDKDLNLKIKIDRNLLENPKFNLINWYLKHVMEDRKFYEQYMLQHKYSYQPIPDEEEDPFFDLPWLVDLEEIDEETSVLMVEVEIKLMKEIIDILERCQPYPGDGQPVDPTYTSENPRFILDKIDDLIEIYDRVQGFETYLTWDIATWDEISLGKWFVEQCAVNQDMDAPWEASNKWMQGQNWWRTTLSNKNRYCHQEPEIELLDESDNSDVDDNDYNNNPDDHDHGDTGGTALALNGVQVDRNKYINVQRKATRLKNIGERLLPKPVIIQIEIDGHPA